MFYFPSVLEVGGISRKSLGICFRRDGDRYLSTSAWVYCERTRLKYFRICYKRDTFSFFFHCWNIVIVNCITNFNCVNICWLPNIVTFIDITWNTCTFFSSPFFTFCLFFFLLLFCCSLPLLLPYLPHLLVFLFFSSPSSPPRPFISISSFTSPVPSSLFPLFFPFSWYPSSSCSSSSSSLSYSSSSYSPSSS